MSRTSLLANEVASILRRVPGLELIDVTANDTRIQFEMTVDSWEALLLLADSGFAANVRGHIFSKFRPGSPEAMANVPRAIIHQFHISSDDDDAATSLETLGAYLVYSMYRLTWISTEDANCSLIRFHAPPVPRPSF